MIGHERPQKEMWLRDQALAASRDGTVITDPNQPDNPTVYANPACECIAGYSVEEAVAKKCRFLQGEDRDQLALEELHAATRQGRISSLVRVLANVTECKWVKKESGNKIHWRR